MLEIESVAVDTPLEAIRYSSCFIRHGDGLLMMERRYEPNMGKRNFVGGKLNPGEAPLACAIREVREETGLDITHIRFAGLVTWNRDTISFRKHAALGMYVFVAEFPADLDPASLEADTVEGQLLWCDITEVLSGDTRYADNVPHFGAPMLAGGEPRDYYCEYQGGRLVRFVTRPLPAHVAELLGAQGSL